MLFNLIISCIIFSSIDNLPAVSIINISFLFFSAYAIAFSAILNTLLFFNSRYDSTSIFFDMLLICSIAAGLYISHVVNNTFFFFFLKCRAIFP